MLRTYKYRLYPTKKQIAKLKETLETCRLVYNSALSERREYYKEIGKSLSRISQQENLKNYKKDRPFLQETHSQVLQNVLFRVERAFDNFFRRIKEKKGKPGYPRFKGQDRYDSFTYPQQGGFQIIQQCLKLSKIGTIKIRLHRPIPITIKTCSIKREIDKWYATLVVEVPHITRSVSLNYNPVGIDMGVKAFAVLSNGDVIQNPEHLKKNEQQLIKKQKRVSRKKKGSSSRRKARIILAKGHRKIRNQRNDFHHKLSRLIANLYNPIIVESLNIKGMVKNHHLSKSISDAGRGQFLGYLTYKAVEAGIQIEKVAPHYTSINCSSCGNPVPKLLSDRIHKCPFCNIVLDRDHNAAINILNKCTVGTTGSHAWGDLASTLHKSAAQVGSLNQEAPSELPVQEG
jgi:putative transposase